MLNLILWEEKVILQRFSSWAMYCVILMNLVCECLEVKEKRMILLCFG